MSLSYRDGNRCLHCSRITSDLARSPEALPPGIHSPAASDCAYRLTSNELPNDVSEIEWSVSVLLRLPGSVEVAMDLASSTSVKEPQLSRYT